MNPEVVLLQRVERRGPVCFLIRHIDEGDPVRRVQVALAVNKTIIEEISDTVHDPRMLDLIERSLISSLVIAAPSLSKDPRFSRIPEYVSALTSLAS